MNNHRNDQPTNQSTELTKWIFWAKVFCVSKIKHRILWREKNQCAFGWQSEYDDGKRRRKNLWKESVFFFLLIIIVIQKKRKVLQAKIKEKEKRKMKKIVVEKWNWNSNQKWLDQHQHRLESSGIFFKKISDCSTNDVWIFFILEKFVAIFFL